MVCHFSNDEHLISDDKWFSSVDATILQAVQDGLALKTGKITSSDNPSATRWQAFFNYRSNVRQETDSSLSTSRQLWGKAEQSATDYGAATASKKSTETIQDRWFTQLGDIYRGSLSSGSSAFDPRDEDSSYRLSYVAWTYGGVMQRASQGIYDPFLVPRWNSQTAQ